MASYSFDVIPAHKDNVTVSVDEFNKHPNDYFDVCYAPFDKSLKSWRESAGLN